MFISSFSPNTSVIQDSLAQFCSTTNQQCLCIEDGLLLRRQRGRVGCWGPFLKRPETLRAIFGCHNYLCNSRTESIWFIKLQSYFSSCCLENTLKDRLSKTSGCQFHIWLFGSETFSGLSRNGPQVMDTRETPNNKVLTFSLALQLTFASPTYGTFFLILVTLFSRNY